MGYKEFFNVDEKGVGHAINGIPCELYEDEEDKTLHLILHYDADSEVLLCARMEKDIEPLLMNLLMFFPVRPRRPYEEPNFSKTVGGIIDALHNEGLKDIEVHGGNIYVEVSAKGEKANYFISYEGETGKCKFATWGDGDEVSLEFPRSLDIRFSQFKECFE